MIPGITSAPFDTLPCDVKMMVQMSQISPLQNSCPAKIQKTKKSAEFMVNRLVTMGLSESTELEIGAPHLVQDFAVDKIR